ncbi:ParM/StbA family protein [Bacillus sp. T3]|uniref:ParM/StbA family protein n=1 Tax=Bacillus sp. T3 TaxID=467262 RepID=UPI0029823289|nr:ParM/StbA family protein [Bacillus sp. T3]
MDFAAIDMGNSLFQAIINGREYLMPNALARCTVDRVDYYDSTQQYFIENLIVEINSHALQHTHHQYYVGFSATEKENVTSVAKNNQKAYSDRSIILLLTMLAYDAVQDHKGETTIKQQYDVVSTALPTRQVRRDREELRKKLQGEHTVTFNFVPGRSNITVLINIVDVLVGIEGSTAYVALIRDADTLKIKHEELMRETLLIADMGGDSTDFVGVRNNKIVDGIEGEIFGVNTYLDRIIQDVENRTGYRFPSRYSLEKKLALGPERWKVVIDQEDVNITNCIEPHLIEMSEKFLDLLDQKRKHVALQEAKYYFCIGGPVKVAKNYIETENQKRAKPMKLSFPEHLEQLNVLGLWILARAQGIRNIQQEVASTKQV